MVLLDYYQKIHCLKWYEVTAKLDFVMSKVKNSSKRQTADEMWKKKASLERRSLKKETEMKACLKYEPVSSENLL